MRRYADIVQNLLQSYARIPYADPSLRDETIFDPLNNHFLLVTTGWQSGERIYATIVHMTVKEDGIWIECNNTDQDLAAELVAAGVPPQDIHVPAQMDFARTAAPLLEATQ